ncbi:MAG: acyl-CoA reductase, partial [Mucilaginibacter polytrichastri]|nr:acyl-CoA reductase [Mucilaginibacter polytrichastri]
MSLALQKRIDGFVKLGNLFRSPDEGFRQVAATAYHRNGWFTPESVNESLQSLGEMLSEDALRSWVARYDIQDAPQPKVIGLVLAGNIPLVGFHDVLCVLISGNHAQIKLSSDDSTLLSYVLRRLTDIEPDFAAYFQLTERLNGFDAVIATGSNNTSRYFEYYFGKVPNIIRKSRTSVTVITEETTPEEIARLGHDIFDYFGLGCRNVSKLFLPKDFLIDRLFEPLESFKQVLHHHKYNNNYDYQKSILLVNRVPHFDNGFLL